MSHDVCQGGVGVATYCSVGEELAVVNGWFGPFPVTASYE